MAMAQGINISRQEPMSPELKEKSRKFLLWIGLVSIAMMFAGLTSGYIVRRQTGTWMKFDLPFTFWISTAIIIMSSITMNWCVQLIRKNSLKMLTTAVLTTLLLGIGFGVFQFISWYVLISKNIYFTGTESSASASYLYILCALHLCHILGGLIALSVIYFKSLRRKYSADNHLGIKLCATYWHFLDGLWVYLFIFMLIMR
ncbi:MAG TPA: cytochrome c oxidase subunit 3 [Bacteroidia bacterium]|jgi:cytochrome c oxidase subunit 3|nr:cytochrome c oxidase subunit 3 [Bacteroidia bacterium]